LDINRNHNRRSFLKTVAAGAIISSEMVAGSANAAAEFKLKYGNYQPSTHPINIRAREMAKQIIDESHGRIDFQIYPNSQLGSDTDMLSQLRAGSIDFLSLSPLTLGTLLPVVQISGLGFVFKDYNVVWTAMDGQLGAYIRAQIDQSSLMAFEKVWDNGYRQITTSNRPIIKPDDLKGLKMRVPPAPLWTSMFKGFNASPATISLQEVYSSLQTKVVDGQENPLALIEASKFYEVQKYCSLTNHMWDGFWFLGNKEKFAKLPPDLREIVTRNVNAAALKQRADVQQLNYDLIGQLKNRGLQFNEVDRSAFRAKLQSAGFYGDWHKRFGAEPWSLLEKFSGKI
jgi:tripartite ATP-independent transporter DctP family solute receptor